LGAVGFDGVNPTKEIVRSKKSILFITFPMFCAGAIFNLLLNAPAQEHVGNDNEKERVPEDPLLSSFSSCCRPENNLPAAAATEKDKIAKVSRYHEFPSKPGSVGLNRVDLA
jgi:hypothetical protein